MQLNLAKVPHSLSEATLKVILSLFQKENAQLFKLTDTFLVILISHPKSL